MVQVKNPFGHLVGIAHGLELGVSPLTAPGSTIFTLYYSAILHPATAYRRQNSAGNPVHLRNLYDSHKSGM